MYQNGNTKIFQLENVKESVLEIRRFAFDKIFSIKKYNLFEENYLNINTINHARNLRNRRKN